MMYGAVMHTLSRRDWLRGAGAVSLGGGCLFASPKQKLDFVFFLIDDLGWTDLACYGSRFYETPHIDGLAREGMRFTDAYASAPVCSPTRGSIMTGKYPARLGMTHVTGFRGNRKARWVQPDSAAELPLAEVMIAEALKTKGYVSACVGKWHLGKEPFYPEKQGFDVNIGGSYASHPSDFFYPAWTREPEKHGYRGHAVAVPGREGEYLTDRLTAEALKFIEDRKDQPFFLYLAHYAVHVPIQAKEELIARFRSRPKPEGSHNNPVYAAMIQSVDESVGRVLGKLEELHIADRTVVFFTSDNGGLNAVEGPNTPATSNLPLRMGKLSCYEGGIRVPLIVRWPGVVKPGSVCRVPVISNDFYPTILEMAGVAGHAVDGLSLTRLLRQKGGLKREALYWHYPHIGYNDSRPSGAIRKGDFKLVEFFEDGRLELYNLTQDIGEQTNLAAKMPKKTAELRDMLHRWRKEVGAQTGYLNPDYKPAPPGPLASRGL